MRRSLISMLLLLLSIQAPLPGELIDLVVTPMTPPELSSVSLIVDAGRFGADAESSSISGNLTVDLIPSATSPATARIPALNLYLGDGISLSLLGGLVRASTAPGDVAVRILEAGEPSDVIDGRFGQAGNLVGLEGALSVSVQPDPINLAELDPTPVDFPEVLVSTIGRQVTLQTSVDLEFQTEIDGGFLLGMIPVTVQVSGGVIAQGMIPVRTSIWHGDDPAHGLPGDGMSWNHPENWSRDGVVDAGFVSGDRVEFEPGSSLAAIGLDEDQTVESVVFGADYTLSGHTLTIESGAVEVADGVTAQVTSNLAGPNGLTKQGAGVLVIDGQVGSMEVQAGAIAGNAIVSQLTIQPEATLISRIDGLDQAAHDTMVVVGQAVVSGALEIVVNQNGGTYDDPQTRGQSHSFTLLTAETIEFQPTGASYAGTSLESTSDPLLFQRHEGEGLFRRLVAQRDTLSITNYLAVLGDADGDREVGFNDFVALADHFAGEGAWPEGDFDGDGRVEFPDFVLLADNFGQITAQPVTVPEPSTICVLVGILGTTSTLWRKPIGRCAVRRA